MKICPICMLELEDDSFYKRKRKNGKIDLQSYCKKCRLKRVGILQRNTRDLISKYKADRGCSVCGERRPYILDFHHVSGDKEYTISLLSSSHANWEKIQKEIDKCVILCANCHREEHHQEKLRGSLTVK